MGKMGGKNPSISRQLQHMELDLLQGVVFPFFLIELLFFLSNAVGMGGKLESMTSFNYSFFSTNWESPNLTRNPTAIVLPGTPIRVSELGSNGATEAWK